MYNKEMNKLFQIEPIRNIRDKTNQDTLLTFHGFNTIAEAKRALQLTKQNEVFDELRKEYNAQAELFNRDENKKHNANLRLKRKEIKRKDVIADMIKRNQEIREVITTKRENRDLQDYTVLISMNIKTTWKISNKTYDESEDLEKVIRCSKNQLDKLISDIVVEYENSLTGEASSGMSNEKTVSEYKYQIISNKPSVNILDIPMKRASVPKLTFLKYFEKIDEFCYEDHKDECVIKTLRYHTGMKEKTIITEMVDISNLIYEREWNEKDGITCKMLLEFCKRKNISCLGFNQQDKQFCKYVKNTKQGSQKYKSIIFYMALGHFYLIKDEKTIRHLSQSFKDTSIVCCGNGTGEEKIERQYIDFCELFPEPIEDELDLFYTQTLSLEEFEKIEVCKFDYQTAFKKIKDLDGNITLLTSKNLNEFLEEYVNLYDAIPKIKYESMTKIKSIQFENGIILTDKNSFIDRDELKQICRENNLKDTNQDIGKLTNELLINILTPKRKQFSQEERNEIITSQLNKCNLCKNDLEVAEIDHIRPISNGGNNDRDNLQALCKSCHRDKTKSEHEGCEHFHQLDYLSSYNNETYKVINSNHFNRVQFCEYLVDEEKRANINEELLKSIDMNKSRRNLIMQSKYDFATYSVLDNIKPFEGDLKTGFYYVETKPKNFIESPIRGNSWVSLPMIEYCLSQHIISKTDIIYQWIPSLQIKNDFFKKPIEKLMSNFEDKKLPVNSLIGMFGRRENSFIEHYVADNDNIIDFDYGYTKFRRPFINKINEDYSIITNKKKIDKLENAYPIYAQILDMEAVELHKMVYLVMKRKANIPICVKTDAVVFECKKEFDISNEFWDSEKTILKYKYEEASLIKRPIKYIINDKFVLEECKYNTIYDTEEMDFNITVAQKIIDSKKGVFIESMPGTGKTVLMNEIIKIVNNDKVIKKLTPTNISALLINGETIDKFAYTYFNNSKGISKLKNTKYIFIDEISMVKERFYKMFSAIKFEYPELIFIISGDFGQLEPVKDRFDFDYKNSHSLFELVDGNKLILTKCRRSDDKLFNLYKNINYNLPYKIDDLVNKPFSSMKNLCFTNRKRKQINTECLNRFEMVGDTFAVEKLTYDDNTQDFKICTGIPIIARTTNKKLNIYNNETFEVINVNKNDITVRNMLREIITVPKKNFNQLFLLAFCITVHKSQGLTFNQPYCIYEFEFFSKKLKYVSLSRATRYEDINILIDGYDKRFMNI